MRSEKVDSAAVLRGEDDPANGTPLAVRDAELARVRGYYSREFLHETAERHVVAPPWRLLLDPTAWEDVEPIEVETLFADSLRERGRWPSLDDVRRRFGRVSNHRAAGEVEGGGDFASGSPPTWIEHDATKVGELGLEPVDLVFTCPPYADLEVYSSDPCDLSTMDYGDFRGALRVVMEQTAGVLKRDRFAVWVVGEARSKAHGVEYGLVADTVKAGQAAGCPVCYTWSLRTIQPEEVERPCPTRTGSWPDSRWSTRPRWQP